MTLVVAWTLLVRVCGVGLMVAGAAHALLPAALGWTAATGRDSGAVTAAVIRMHVGFLGAFLIIAGAVSLVGAAELMGGGAVAVTFTAAMAVLFAARWVCELILVPRALRADDLAARWGLLHRLALVVAWPVLVISYAGAAVLGIA